MKWLVASGILHAFVDGAAASLCDKHKRAKASPLAFGDRVFGECPTCRFRHNKVVASARRAFERRTLPDATDHDLALAWPDDAGEP